MDILISFFSIGSILAGFLWVALKEWRSRYSESINQQRANDLISRLVAVRNNKSMTPRRRQELTRVIIQEMHEHHDNREFVTELKENVPDNVSDIRERFKDAI